MTVKELKEKLNKYDDNLRVYLDTHYGENSIYEEIIETHEDHVSNNTINYKETIISLTNEDY